MSKNLQTMLRDALLNNTYDYSYMHRMLHHVWQNSYSYLYDLQKQYIGYEELHYFSNDEISRDAKRIGKLYLNKRGEACFDINYDFIHVTSDKKFYKSEFYHKEFSFLDMVNNPTIFYKIPLLVIDDQTIYDYKLKAEHSTFQIILPFGESFVISKKRNKETGDIIYLNHKIQILVLDNDGYHRGEVSLNQFVKDDKNFTLTYWKKNNGGFCKVQPDKKGLYLVSFHLPRTAKKGYELGGFFIPSAESDESHIVIPLSEKYYKELTASKTTKFYMSILFANELNFHTLYTKKNYVTCHNGQCELFILEHENRKPYAMPIPVEDFIVIKRSKETGKDTLVKNTDAVKLYYPNIYEIIDPDMKEGDEYHFAYFYHNAEFLKYNPAFSYYYEYLDLHYKGKPIEEIIDGIYRGVIDPGLSLTNEGLEAFEKVFQKMLDYSYYDHKYGEIDFHQRYLKEKEEHQKDPNYEYLTEVEYKEQTLRNWINDTNPFILRDYVLDQDKLYYPIYHLWTNTIDLKSRLRNDTKPELGETDGYKLDEPCYVFNFRNEDTKLGKMLDIRIYVDGLYATRVTQIRYKFTDFFYIPTSIVTDHSYIEIEVFPNYSHMERLHFYNMTDKKTVTLVEPADGIYPTAEDLYYISPSGYMLDPNHQSKTVASDTTQKDGVVKSVDVISLKVDGKEYEETTIYDKTKFEITAKYKEGDFKVKTTDPNKPVRFTQLKTFNIAPLSEEVIGKDIILCISKTPYGIEYLMEKAGYPYIFLGDVRFNFDLDYIRIFHNGRLLPRSKYNLHTNWSVPRLYVYEWCDVNDSVYVDITPYKYKEIFYKEKLDSVDEIVDLKDVITRPFDIRYYDVYMNGRKLSLNNVFTLSPWQITFVNLKSIHHLLIYEKERDYEYFGMNYKDHHYYYTLEELLDAPFLEPEEKKKLVERFVEKQKDPELEIKPNKDTEMPQHYEDNREYAHVESFYFNELIPRTFVNPNRIQYDSIILNDEYPTVIENFKVASNRDSRNEEEKERRKNYLDILHLDPDHAVKGKNGEVPEYVYCVGHPNEVVKETLDMSTYLVDKKDALIDTYKKE